MANFCLTEGDNDYQIQQVCTGAGAVVAVTLTETTTPTVQVTTDGAFFNLIATLTLSAVNPGAPGPLPLFTANVSASVVIPQASLKFQVPPSMLHRCQLKCLMFQGWTVSAEVDVTGATLSVTKSSIGSIDQAGLEQLWQIGLLALVNGELSGIVQKGIPLPDLPFVDITNPSIAFGTGDLVACGDIQYTGPLKF